MVSIMNSIFVNNSASIAGGAISTDSELDVINSTFINNTNLHINLMSRYAFNNINNSFSSDEYVDFFANASMDSGVVNL